MMYFGQLPPDRPTYLMSFPCPGGTECNGFQDYGKTVSEGVDLSGILTHPATAYTSS